jgi:hypothetical protein
MTLSVFHVAHVYLCLLAWNCLAKIIEEGVFYSSSFVALCEKIVKCNVVAEFVLCLLLRGKSSMFCGEFLKMILIFKMKSMNLCLFGLKNHELFS